MKKYLIISLTLLVSVFANAQDPHFSQFFSSPLTLNPAFTGKFDGLWRLATNHRDQWPSFNNAYVTTSASLDFPIMQKKIPTGDVFGLGISGVSDASANNILKLNYGSLSMSYHKALDEDGYNTIGAGFQGTFSSLTLDVSQLNFQDMLTQNGFTGVTSDIVYNGNNRGYFDANAGILYSGSTNGINNYYLGVSMYHINRPKVSFKDENWYLNGRTTIHGGGSFPVSNQLTVHASAIYQLQNKASETTLGAALAANLNNDQDKPTSVYLGAWVRLNDAIIPYVGLEIAGLRVGASYDFNVSTLKAGTAARGGSEFSIIYIKQQVGNKGIPCPKF